MKCEWCGESFKGIGQHEARCKTRLAFSKKLEDKGILCRGKQVWFSGEILIVLGMKSEYGTWKNYLKKMEKKYNKENREAWVKAIKKLMYFERRHGVKLEYSLCEEKLSITEKALSVEGKKK